MLSEILSGTSCFLALPPSYIFLMPRQRRSERQRLPKGERRVSYLKSATNSPSTTQLQSSMQLLTLASDRSPTLPIFSSSASSSAHTILPVLPDDVWLKIITHAGTRAAFSCLTVSKQLSNVANTVIALIRSLDISRHFSGNLVPSSTAVLAVLRALPRLESITVSKWQFGDSFPDIANVIGCYFTSTVLRSVTFSGVEVAPGSLRQLFERCPAINVLRIGDHPSVDDKLCQSLASVCDSFRLNSLQIHNTSTVSRAGISALLRKPAAAQLFLATIRSLDAIFHDESTSPSEGSGRTFHAKMCSTLHEARFSASSKKKIDEINISMSRALVKVTLRATRQLALQQSSDSGFEADENNNCNACFPVSRILFCNCPALRDICLHPAGHDVANDEDQEDEAAVARACALPLLEELNLFGARQLSQRTFSFTFGLSDSGLMKMPLLRSLNLNGTSIERAVLDGYTCLEFADFSGSALHTLVIRNCWNLRRLMVQGRSVPLTHVQLTLSASCDVVGRRPNWNWECLNSCQTISFF